MKIINRIKALFTHQDSPVEMELSAAEIKEGKAFLHPKGEEKVTYLVKSEDIEIRLSKGRSLTPKDIIKIAPKTPSEKEQTPISKQDKEKSPALPPRKVTPSVTIQKTTSEEFDRFKKRTFTVSLYQDEYDALISIMKEYGYKRSDFVMACVNSATKTTMERAHKKIMKANRQRLEEKKAINDSQTEK